ncbi:MAG: hypothetical protein HUK23_08080 [Sphaerochaetaceae bacterium]|nr:hypothetical protein [Sphaerochaetaceae bacterium]
MVKNATLLNQADGSQAFNWIGGDFFHGKRDNSGMSLVLAISMSLI